MELEFQLLDCDYIILQNAPVVRLFGITADGKSVCAFHKGYYPYFYVLPKESRSDYIEEFLIKKFNGLVTKIEKAHKFQPIGYRPEKTMVLKITLNDPSRVPEVRDTLVREKDVESIFEADILFKYRYMADFGFSGFKWLKVAGTQTRTTTVKTDITLDVSDIRQMDNLANCDLKHLSLDIETIAQEGVPDSKTDIIGMISLAFSTDRMGEKSLVLVAKGFGSGNKTIKTFPNEKEMLKEFLKIIESYDPDTLIGYNINNFDFPYLLARLRENNLPQTLGRCNQKPATSRKIGSYNKNTALGRIIVDPYELIKEAIRKGNLRLKRLGLGDVSRVLLNDQKHDISHSEIFGHWNGDRDQVTKLAEYARKDSELALRLVLETGFLDKFFELSKVSCLLLQDCLDGGEAQRVENLLLREFNKNEYVLPNKPTDTTYSEQDIQELKGALVLEPKVGLHTDPIVYLDFKSMYPSIFIAYNICPTTLVKAETSAEIITTPHGTKYVSKNVRKGVLPTILEKLIEERDNVRKEERASTDKSIKRLLDAKQLALKIMTNAFYGYTGYLRARLYVIDIANTITGCGRYLINKTKDIVETKSEHEVIYGDTDSIMIKVKTDDLDTAYEIGGELETMINSELIGIVQMKIEKVFKTLLILSKKRYVGLAFEKSKSGWKEDMVMKGIETVRRDWCDAATKTLYDVLNILLKEQDPKKAFAYVKGLLIRLEKNEVPIEDLVITKSISKSISSYKGIQPHVELVKKLKKRNGESPGVGDRVSFVIVKGMQLLSERAEDPEYVKSKNIPIDSKYYIENQIIPPLERVFEVIGSSKTELMGIGRQTLLKEVFKPANKRVAETVESFDGFICNNCNKSYRRIPLLGKCMECQGEVLFISEGVRAKTLLSGNNLKV